RLVSGADDALHAVLEDGHVEVEQEAEMESRGLKIGHDLCLVDRGQMLHSLQFHDETIRHQEIDESFSDRMPFVGYVHWTLRPEGDVSEGELDLHRFLIHRLQVAGTEMAVYFDGSTDDLVSPRLHFRVRLAKLPSFPDHEFLLLLVVRRYFLSLLCLPLRS